MKTMTKMMLVGLALLMSGCGAVDSFARRSDMSLEAKAINSIEDGHTKSVTSRLDLHGSNRDVLAAFKNALEFTLKQIEPFKSEEK